MKIAMIGQKGIPAIHGGVETCIEQLACRLASHGHRVLVYCRSNYTPADTPKRYGGIDLRILPSIGTKHLDAISHTFLSIVDLVWRDVDVVHLHSAGPAALALLPRLGGLPVVVTIHAADWLRDKWSAPAKFCLRKGLDLAVRSANVVTAVSPFLADFLSEKYGINARYIPNGICPQSSQAGSLSDLLGISAPRFILFVGRLVPEKDVHLLIEAFEGLAGQQAFADTHLLLAGDSSFSDDYREKLRSLAGPKTHFLGRLSQRELAMLYEEAAVCVLPSRLEGMPLVLLEAASHACPVIAADTPENRHVLAGLAQYFVPGKVQALQDLICRTLGNPAPARELALAARKHVLSSFSWDEITQRMEEVYLCAVG